MSKRTFQFVEPLDYMILETLPDVGTTVGGFYQVGEQVSSLKKKFAPLTSDQLASRLRAMQAEGYTRQVTMLGGQGKGAWQRTESGAEALAEWKENGGRGS